YASRGRGRRRGRARGQPLAPHCPFARRPPTAALILADGRRSQPLPAWRVRTARAATTAVAAGAIAGWTLTTGASYSLVGDFAHIRPVTAVTTDRPQVGVLVDAPANQVP